MKFNHRHGFTLIEVLVAIALVAAAMTLAYRGLSAVIGGSETLSARLDDASDMDRLFSRIDEDLWQRMPRDARAGVAISGHNSEGAGVLSLTTLTSDASDRANARWVEYRLADGALLLSSRNDATLNPDSPTRRDILFSSVQQFSVRFRSRDGQWYDQWPAPAANPNLLKAIEIRMAMGAEDVTRLFVLP